MFCLWLHLVFISSPFPPQANAALALEQGDLTTFTDLVNTKDVESGSREAHHWINASTGEARGSLVELAIEKGRVDFLDVLLRAGARWDVWVLDRQESTMCSQAGLGW